MGRWGEVEIAAPFQDYSYDAFLRFQTKETENGQVVIVSVHDGDEENTLIGELTEVAFEDLKRLLEHINPTAIQATPRIKWSSDVNSPDYAAEDDFIRLIDEL